MVRVKRGVTAHARHKKVLDQTKGHSGSRHRLYKTAHESLMHALAYQYRDRRNRKRDFRRLWIERINAAARQLGFSYSRFIGLLRAQGIEVNRKMLADLAVDNPSALQAIIDAAQNPHPAAPEPEPEPAAEPAPAPAPRRRRAAAAPAEG